jgi:hypothetical protein
VEPKVIALRRDDTCASCAQPLAAGSRARWNAQTRTVRCLACDSSGRSTAVPPALDVGAPLESKPALAIDGGVAGQSARQEFDRRHAKRDARIEARWGAGTIGRLVKALSDDPQSTTAWRSGAVGEERVAATLHERIGDRAVLLHDRKVPKSRANIDHLAIAKSGIWIIDTKKFTGKIERRDVGGLFRTDVRLCVNGRDRTKLVSSLTWQLDAVRNAIAGTSLPVHQALCFVGGEWPLLFAKPFRVNNVHVCWPVKMADLIDSEGPLTVGDVERIGRSLAEALPRK